MDFEQLSLFTLSNNGEAEAVNCMDNRVSHAEQPEPWMKRLVPNAEYVLGKNDPRPLMLYPVSGSAQDIKPGLQYMHYLIEGQLYASIYVGREEI